MTLVDTSVWIDFLGGRVTPQTTWLATAVTEGELIAVCGIVLSEILQGYRAESVRRKIERRLARQPYLDLSRRGHILAADIYCSALAAGRPIRNTIDCLIAACAISHGVPLLQNDRDFANIAAVSKLRLITA